MELAILFLLSTAIFPADFTKVQLHLHVEYINENETCVTCWPKTSSCPPDGGSYRLYYNQANPNDSTEDREPCKNLGPPYETAHLVVQQEVPVVCKGHGNQNETWISVTVSPLNSDDDSISDTTGNDSDMLLKCHSTDHKVSCWNLSLIHVSNEDCNVNNSFGIISTFSRSLYPNIELEKNILTLLETLDDVYNLDESENSCMKVTVSFLPHLDIASSATPESAYPQPTSCPEQVPCEEQATDALNQLIQDKPTYVLVSFPILVTIFALLVLAIAIVLIFLAKFLCRWCKEKCSSQTDEKDHPPKDKSKQK